MKYKNGKSDEIGRAAKNQIKMSLAYYQTAGSIRKDLRSKKDYKKRV